MQFLVMVTEDPGRGRFGLMFPGLQLFGQSEAFGELLPFQASLQISDVRSNHRFGGEHLLPHGLQYFEFGVRSLGRGYQEDDRLGSLLEPISDALQSSSVITEDLFLILG